MKSPTDNASDSEPPGAGAGGGAGKLGEFTTTHWSQVVMAGKDDTVVARKAMGDLYQVYKLPIYNFICRKYRCNHHDAEDLMHGFFAHLVEKATMKRADRDLGQFRSFLLGSLNKFRANARDYALAGKRGGQYQFTSLDEPDAPQVGGQGPAVPLLADKAFNRDWAFALVGQAREQLKKKYIKEEKGLLFATMEPALLRDDAKNLYAEWAVTLKMTQEAVAVAFHRLRRRFGKALRHEVAQTVTNPEDAKEELRCLFAAMSD